MVLLAAEGTAMTHRPSFRILATTILTGLGVCPANAQRLPPTAQFQASMDLAVALRSGELGSAVDLFAPKAVVMSADGAIIDGREEIASVLQGLFGKGTVELAIVSLESGESEALGFDAGSYDVTITSRKGERRKETGQYLAILRSDGEGRWRVVYGMWTRTPPAADPPH